jgi:hypothetical protein
VFDPGWQTPGQKAQRETEIGKAKSNFKNQNSKLIFGFPLFN